MLTAKELLSFDRERRIIEVNRHHGHPIPGTSSQTIKVEYDDKKPDIKRLEQGTDYAKKYKQTEDRRLISASFDLFNNAKPAKRVKIDEGDELLEVQDEMALGLEGEIETPTLPELAVYDRYQFDLPSANLPIRNKRDEIMDQINKNMFIVLTANTGTGKSTQIPQYILEDAKKNRQNCNIVVTQPQRIAAISVAKRVAIERLCDCGTLVGYQVGSEKLADTQANSDTRILFCTTGVLLQKLVNEKSLKNFTHVIVDEIHVRDINIDMLLIVLRRLVATKNPSVKIILMSATMNSEKLASYFITFKPYDDDSSDSSSPCSPAPVLNLDIERPFEIRLNYLDDLQSIGNAENLVDMDKPGISNELYTFAVKTMISIIDKSRMQDINPSFLVFLPGIYEIGKFKRELYKPNSDFDVSEFKISVLHSQLTDDYRSVCDETVDNRIILSTNIAESSVTLPGIRYVIDFCLTKYKETDTSSNSTRLKLDWCSLESLHQRAGRVGRMQCGQVVRLIKRAHFDILPQEVRPEIKRVSLEFAVLKTKQLDLGRPAAVLALALDPPDKEYITDAIITLKEIGALTRFDKTGKFCIKDGELTPVGKVIHSLPVDVRIAKLIILGYVFRCIKDCVIMGVGLNYRSIFTLSATDAKQKLEEYNHKLDFSEGSASDPIAIMNAYNHWKDMMKKTEGSSDHRSTREKRDIWCRTQFLSMKHLKDMDREVEDVTNRLTRQKLNCNDYFPYNEEKKCVVLKMCLAGAFYPNYFSFGGNPPLHEDFKAMQSLNPCNVVYFKGSKYQNIMKLYKNQIVDMLYDMGVTDDPESIKIHQNLNSQKVFVEFKSYKNEKRKCVPGIVKSEVYRALKLRKLDYDVAVRVMNDKKEERKAAINGGLGYFEEKSGHFSYQNKPMKNFNYCIYPRNTCERGKIIHIIDCGKFFFQPARAEIHLQELTQNTIQKCCRRVHVDQHIAQGSRILVLYDNSVRRAKVLEVLGNRQDQDRQYEVYLIDLGTMVEVSQTDVFEMDGKSQEATENLMETIFGFPPQCYECRLSSLIPSPIKCPNGWSAESKRQFFSFILNKNHGIKINSFVDCIASVEVYVEDHQEYTINLNDTLIFEGLAIPSDDSYLQQCDQISRENIQTNETLNYETYEDEFAEEAMFPPANCWLVQKVKLEGPMTLIECSTVDKLASFVSNKSCQVESSSVNSVLMDPYPFDTSTKVLVAASLVDKENHLQLCQTTILPHVPGMATLLSLIFAPTTEIRLNHQKNRVAHILCGLGGLANGDRMKSIFGEHDILVRNDIAIDNKDLEKINLVRSQMSSILQFSADMRPDQCAVMRDKVVTALLDLLSEKRRLIPTIDTNADLDKHWKKVHRIKQEEEIPYPPHFLPENLVPLKSDVRQRLKDNSENEMLNFLNGKARTYSCKLCKMQTFDSINELKIHLLTTFHNDRLMQLRDEITPM